MPRPKGPDPDSWTSGHEKLLSYLLDITRKEDFIRDLKYLRERFGIPEAGLEVDENNIFQMPEVLHRKEDEFYPLLEWLADKHYMGPFKVMRRSLQALVLYNAIVLPEQYDLCVLDDARVENYTRNRYGETLYSKATHPVIIRITPYASENDIISFVRQHYASHIWRLQELYKDNRVKVHTKRKRDNKSLIVADFIFDHRKLSSKATMLKMNAELGILIDPGVIKSIKHREMKRRIK